MKLLILGSGGAQPPPRPGCACRVCKEARAKGIPYYRTGPSLYVPEQNILFDVPEDIREQLNREKIGHVKHVFLSHWHPDHTMGIRLFEQMNYNFALKPDKKSTLYISKETANNLGNQLLPSFIPLYERREILQVRHIREGEAIEFGNLEITPYALPNSDTFLFKLREGGKVAVHAPCDIRAFPIKEELMKPDVLILHLGYFRELVTSRFLLYYGDEEDSFDENLQTIRRLGAKRTVFMHIEEAWGRSYDDYKRMEDQLKEFNVEFAHDGMTMIL